MTPPMTVRVCLCDKPDANSSGSKHLTIRAVGPVLPPAQRMGHLRSERGARLALAVSKLIMGENSGRSPQCIYIDRLAPHLS
jgi:hypothetical protein